VNTLRIAAIVSLSVVTACSGGGGGTVAPAAPVAAVPSGAGQAALTIVVPAAGSKPSATSRAPRYVSPSSAALQIAVNADAPTTYGLTPQSPGCAVQAGNVTCTFMIAAPSGSNTIALTLVDGVGKVLSRNVVTASLVAGAVTPLGVTLAAVPASVIVVPGAGSAVDGTAPPYRAAGLFPQAIQVEALDADGNVIIGPGAPAVTNVSVTSGGAYATVAPAGTTDPSAYRLTPVDGTAGGKTVGVSATVQGVPLADGSTSPPLTNSTAYTFTPAIAIASGPLVNVYSVESHQLVRQIRLCQGCSVTLARGIVSDATGALYVLYNTVLIGVNSSVAIFAPGATAPKTTLGSAQGVHMSTGIALDASGALYVANGTGFRLPPPSVVKIPAGATKASYTISGTPAQPGGIAVDSSGKVYLADTTGAVLVYPPLTQKASTTLSNPSLSAPSSIAMDASGGLYVVDSTNKDIAYFAAGQTALTTTLNHPSFSSTISALSIDPGGNLWVSINNAQSIERLAAGALPNAVSPIDTIGAGGYMAWIP
jgi:hypothetical protein